MGFGRWYNAQKVGVQVAIVGGTLAIVGAVVAGGFGIVDVELAKPGPQNSTSAPAPTLTTSTPALVTSSPASSATIATSCDPAPAGLGAQLIYCDDFHSNANVWEDPNAAQWGVYQQGAYVLTAVPGGDPQVGAPQQAPLGLHTSVNVLISVRATATSVPGGQYGLMCRGGPDAQFQGKGYVFVLEGSTAIIEKLEYSGGPTRVDHLATSQHAVPIRNGPNLLQASCQTVEGGPAMSGQPGKAVVLLHFWVNGEEAASYRDIATPFTSGYVGVVCLTDDSAPDAIRATFQRFGVYRV